MPVSVCLFHPWQANGTKHTEEALMGNNTLNFEKKDNFILNTNKLNLSPLCIEHKESPGTLHQATLASQERFRTQVNHKSLLTTVNFTSIDYLWWKEL